MKSARQRHGCTSYENRDGDVVVVVAGGYRYRAGSFLQSMNLFKCCDKVFSSNLDLLDLTTVA